MDFMHDRLAGQPARNVRLLTVVDEFTRESLALEVGRGLRAYDVIEVLRRWSWIAVHRRLFAATTVQNLPPSRSINGRIAIRSRWSFHDRGSLPAMASSRRSTAHRSMANKTRERQRKLLVRSRTAFAFRPQPR